MDTKQDINKMSAKIAAVNDEFRRSMSGCTVTRGVAALAPLMNEIFVRVRDFSEFTEDNDPYGEHDFGSFEAYEHKLFWKIDYYDENLEKWCDPLSPDCNRVLTIMLAEEY
jgi:hypothetical protein